MKKALNDKKQRRFGVPVTRIGIVLDKLSYSYFEVYQGTKGNNGHTTNLSGLYLLPVMLQDGTKVTVAKEPNMFSKARKLETQLEKGKLFFPTKTDAMDFLHKGTYEDLCNQRYVEPRR